MDMRPRNSDESHYQKAKMEGVTAGLVDVAYDGKRHDVTFLGIKYDGNGGMSYNSEPVIISDGYSEGNAYATDVYIEAGSRSFLLYRRGYIKICQL